MKRNVSNLNRLHHIKAIEKRLNEESSPIYIANSIDLACDALWIFDCFVVAAMEKNYPAKILSLMCMGLVAIYILLVCEMVFLALFWSLSENVYRECEGIFLEAKESEKSRLLLAKGIMNFELKETHD